MKGNARRIAFWFGLLASMAATLFVGCGQDPNQKTETSFPVSAAGERFVTDGASNLIEEKISATMSIGIRVQMIGDDADLQQIDNDEMERIALLVKEIVTESGFSLRVGNDTSEIRNALCSDINSALKRTVVNEVRFSRFTIGEYRTVQE